MRPLLLLLLLFAVPSLAQDVSGTVRRDVSSQALTRAEPTSSCIDATPIGMDMRGVRGFRVGVDVLAGQTVTGGILRAWYFDFGPMAWARNPDLDITLSVGIGDQWHPDQATVVRTGCLLYATDGVTLSGAGATVIIRLTAWVGGA